MSKRLYTTIPAPKVPRNTFDRSAPNSLSMPFQRVVPTKLEEVLPGDFWSIGQETFARLQPMQAPVMNNMKISQHWFYVPLRTMNKHFAEFMFNNRTGDYSEVLPYTHTGVLYAMISSLNNASGVAQAVEMIRLYDYLGIPFRYKSRTSAQDLVNDWLQDPWNIKVRNANNRVNILPFVAYQKIWSEYFRDENVLDDPLEELEDRGHDYMDWTGDLDNFYAIDDFLDIADLLFVLRPRAWQHDRFTSALPFAQRGPDVLLPIDGVAPVVYREGSLDDRGPQWITKVNGQEIPGDSVLSVVGNARQAVARAGSDGGVNEKTAYDPDGSLLTDFRNAELTTTINTFRRAERLQRWYENSARGGVRPNEATLAHFGVHTPDSTLDRAEFLGGSMQPIVVSEVAQTSETTESSPQGTLAGKGTAYKSAGGFRHYFTEHGFIFGFTSVLVRANYWQGLPKVFSRMQRDEYYWPEFANLGEEPVFTKELYAAAAEDAVFGYVPRYSDYKSAVGEVHGDLRSSLKMWTQLREFDNEPALNEEFLFSDPSLDPFVVQSYTVDPIIVTIQYHVKASRLMPFYGIPTI